MGTASFPAHAAVPVRSAALPRAHGRGMKVFGGTSIIPASRGLGVLLWGSLRVIIKTVVTMPWVAGMGWM